MYIFLSLFSVDGFYCTILLDIVRFCCCTPDNDVDSPSLDMGRHSRRPRPNKVDIWLRHEGAAGTRGPGRRPPWPNKVDIWLRHEGAAGARGLTRSIFG